ncbi:MAG: hypothetical protein LBV49_07385 [Azonexus sp.]|nr:hypothetical protein [Azonexus sp.]
MFTNFLYVQIRENFVQVRNVNNPRTFQRSASTPFSHPRMLVGNFTAAAECLKKAISEARGSGLFLSTSVVIHPLEKIDGGLTQVEDRLLRELALGAGASKVAVWVGPPLSDAEVISKFKEK